LDRPGNPRGERGTQASPGGTRSSEEVGVDIKQVYLTSGESDLLIIVETANADNIPKFAMALGSLGNVRTRTVRAWPEAEMTKFISELP
jgi:uncharacterized protein with GYD domain